MKFWRVPFDKEDKTAALGELRIIKDRCKGCGFCVEFCPSGCLVLSDEFNKKGYHPPVLIPDKTCHMCGLCQALCPEFAIFCVLPQLRNNK